MHHFKHTLHTPCTYLSDRERIIVRACVNDLQAEQAIMDACRSGQRKSVCIGLRLSILTNLGKIIANEPAN